MSVYSFSALILKVKQIKFQKTYLDQIRRQRKVNWKYRETEKLHIQGNGLNLKKEYDHEIGNGTK